LPRTSVVGAELQCVAKRRVTTQGGVWRGDAGAVDNSPPDNQKAVCWVVAGATNDPLGGVR
jgi:hypothetical protein